MRMHPWLASVAPVAVATLLGCGSAEDAGDRSASSQSEVTVLPRNLAYRTFPAWGWLENSAQSCLAGATGQGARLTGTESGWCDSTYADLAQLFQYDPMTGHILTWHGNCVGGIGSQTSLWEGNCPQYVAAYETWTLDQQGQYHMAEDTGQCINAGRGYGTTDTCSDWATESFWTPVNRNGADTGYVPSTIAPYAPAQTGLVLGVIGGRAYNGVNGQGVQIESSGTDTISERWWYDPSTREIHLTDSPNMCLDVRGMGTANGTYLQIWQCTGTTNQQWVYAAPNQWVSVQSAKCMDVPGESVAPGTPVWIWDCWGGLNQQWDGPHAAGGPQRGGG
jgi:hypothetical protein